MVDRDQVIATIQAKVTAMLQERQALEGAEPSAYWSDFCNFFSYTLRMNADDLSAIRLHTWHLTSDHYQYYYLAEDAARDLFRQRWSRLTRETPHHLILSEPPGGIGFQFGDHLISRDILRYQQVINRLNESELITSLAEQAHPVVLEIGSGYGGLVHHLRNILARVGGGSPTFVIVDIPEVLLFSATYLSLHNPACDLYLYDTNDNPDTLLQDGPSSYDFVLMPTYRLATMTDWRFDLALNVASFQEMRQQQVETYLRFLAKTCHGVVYSWNQDRNPKNFELGASAGPGLTELLSRYFDITEVAPARKEEIRRLAVRFGSRISGPLERLTRRPELLHAPYREHLCRPKALAASPPAQTPPA